MEGKIRLYVRERGGGRWQGVCSRTVPNPDYIPSPSEGEDTRTANQKRPHLHPQRTIMFPASVSDEGAATVALAEWWAELKAEESAKALPSASMTVAECVKNHIDTLEATGNVERATASDYRTIARAIGQGFKGIKMCDLTKAMIQNWENGLTESGLAPRTVTKYHRLLSKVCSEAVNNDELPKNPCKGVKLPKRVAPSPNSLTEDGFKSLSLTLSQMEPSHVVTGATIALYTGCRLGEVCGLRWRCYDKKRGVLTVEESIGKASGTTYSKAPKTKQSRRAIPVTGHLAKELERRRREMERELEEQGITLTAAEFGELYVIGYPEWRTNKETKKREAHYYSPELLSRGWRSLSQAFGLIGTQGRAITFHDLRHTFATRAIAAGIDVRTTSAILGHANPSITLDIYADADENSKRRAVEHFDMTFSTFDGIKPLAELAEPTERS